MLIRNVLRYLHTLYIVAVWSKSIYLAQPKIIFGVYKEMAYVERHIDYCCEIHTSDVQK